MKDALLLGMVVAALGCSGCTTKLAEAPETPASLIVAEPRARAQVAAALPAPPADTARAAADDDAEQDWGNAALNCEGRAACLAIAARVPSGAPRDVAANVRAKANGADGRCLVEAMMVAWNDDAAESCNDAAKHALSKADERLIRATPLRAARDWRRLEAREAEEARRARSEASSTKRR